MTHLRPHICILGAAIWLGGCAMSRQGNTLPIANTVIREQLVIHSDFALPKQNSVLDELVSQRSELTARLALPVSDEPIHIFLFESPSAFSAYALRYYPAFADRRAFFVETDGRLAVYTQWGNRIDEDLRHEVSHGYLHAVLKNLPLWLDEGLAENFEVPRELHGLNRPHVALLERELKRAAWKPNLPRLEGLPSAAAMSQLDYAESWLWTHWLLETTPERRRALQEYLAALRTEPVARPLSQTIPGSTPEQDLLTHLHSLATAP